MPEGDGDISLFCLNLMAGPFILRLFKTPIILLGYGCELEGYVKGELCC